VKVWGHRMIFSSLHWHLPPSLNASAGGGTEEKPRHGLENPQEGG